MTRSALSQPQTAPKRWVGGIDPVRLGDMDFGRFHSASPQLPLTGTARNELLWEQVEAIVRAPRKSTYSEIRKAAMEAIKRESAPRPQEQWLKLVNDEHADTGLKSISQTIKLLFDRVEKDRPESIDLSQIDVLGGNPQHIIAVLRTLYAWRDKVRGWDELQRSARSALAARGVAADVAMQGLDK